MHNINSSISQFAKKLNLKTINERIYIVGLWSEIIGEEVAKKTQADRIVDGVLFIEVSSSSWLNEISFLKEDIIQKYNEKLGKKTVKEVKCYIKKNDDIYIPTIRKKSEKDNKRIIINEKLSIEDKKQIEDQTNTIEDERLREALQKFLENGRIKELSMLSQGWKKCGICKTPHNDKSDNCISCNSK
ncbi:MAG: DUF721 domain-containing protein [Candidatus Sericytochromatia bacterium]|nr:DUF721 domain-containing protein [Candidatus Sericytochromatia bacterium]